MSVYCDLHAVEHPLDVRAYAKPDNATARDSGVYVVVVLRQGTGSVTLYLSPANAASLIDDMEHVVAPLLDSKEQRAVSLPE